MDHLIWVLLIGLAAGWLAGQIARGRGLGLVGNLVVGVVGAVVGGFVFRLLGLGPTNLLGSLISATVGALVVLAVLGSLSHRRRRR